MHDVMFVPPDHAATYPRLPALPPRMQRFGVVGSSSPAERSSHGVDTPRPWTLAFTWPVGTSAWATFMTTQDRLQPQRLALLPPLLIPLTYLTHMADLLTEPFETTMVRWLAHANGSQRRLDALISGLFSAWMRGPSQAAARYRSLVPQAATAGSGAAGAEYPGPRVWSSASAAGRGGRAAGAGHPAPAAYPE
jgi:hypothetical protein